MEQRSGPAPQHLPASHRLAVGVIGAHVNSGSGEAESQSGDQHDATAMGIGVLLGLMVLTVASRADEAAAVKAIEKLDGQVRMDFSRSGKQSDQ